MAIECSFKWIKSDPWELRKVNFIKLSSVPIEDCGLVYIENEIKIANPLKGWRNSYIVNDLQLVIDNDGRLLFVWGKFDIDHCEGISNFPLQPLPCSLKAVTKEPLLPAYSYKINQSMWPTYINKKEGWICVGDHTTVNMEMIEFSHGCVAALRNNELIALWLHPKMV